METIQHELEARGGWQFDALISSTLSHLGLNADARIDALSGGWKKRVALARALASKPTCCCWTSRPTTSTSPPSNGWKA
ncbi:ABC transporter ATPase component [Chromobacterium violaceum]|uniref:ABC transporter ATPase component n=1 Tax=Chromobacterium violaceum TaxID=536 RepID=A0A3S5DLK9_CHRVL|nr:ABC transporter ATPase component [Chromobacterium violaceum]